MSLGPWGMCISRKEGSSHGASAVTSISSIIEDGCTGEITHQENWLRRSFRCGLDMATINTTWHGSRPPLSTLPNARAATGDRHPNTYCSSADTTYPNAKSYANKSNHSP